MARKDPETFWSWLRTVRVRTLLLIMVPCMLLLPLCLLFLLPRGEGGARVGVDSADTARRVLGLIEFDHLSGPEIKGRIEELLRIKNSVQSELRDLEKRRSSMQQEISLLGSKIEQLRMEGSRETKELERLRVSIQQVKVAQQEYIERNTPDIAPPLPLLPSAADWKRLSPPPADSVCSFSSCFDFSRCSISSQFPVFVYPYEGKETDKQSLQAAYTSSRYITLDPSKACVFVVLVDEYTVPLASLPHWQGDGRNHMVVTVDSQALNTVNSQALNTGRALLVTPMAVEGSWRPGFDLILPAVRGEKSGWADLPTLAPIVREVLLVFQGEQLEGVRGQVGRVLGDSEQQDREVVGVLKDMTTSGTSDKFLFSFVCSDGLDPAVGPGETSEWALCGTAQTRAKVLTCSTFCLVLPPSNHSLLSTPILQVRLLECLQAGSVPVLLSPSLALPLSEVVDWRQVAIILPLQRVTELHFLLRTIPHSDLFALKRQGRLVLQTYLTSPPAMVESILAVMRDRLTIPSLPLPDTPSPSVFNSSFTPQLMDHLPADVEPDESLGPLEPPFPSPSFKRNYSSLLSHGRHTWNTLFSAHNSAPYTPWEPVLSTEAKFHGSGLGFRPICGGEGGSGKEFSQAIGGNIPQEQFTVVMLTYEREQVLINSLARLYGLPYLNKVVVVWNSPQPPAPDLQWPDIGVPIHVVRTEKNSLNNRFFPYSDIETEAVLSVDDDAHLRHDEIVFGFRVWRENRDRLVGFPGRFHAWDANHTSWNYNSNYSCELSMVLTGAAFYHKYYSYVYTHVMEPAIRDLVDEFMNCEDLAMNFLISHITRKPPVKVTSRWTFRCPGCPVSLSEDDSHFQERHHCLNFFTRVYGYMPLLYTQYRADSVLFKTRIPPDKQKCFKFI